MKVEAFPSIPTSSPKSRFLGLNAFRKAGTVGIIKVNVTINQIVFNNQSECYNQPDCVQ